MLSAQSLKRLFTTGFPFAPAFLSTSVRFWLYRRSTLNRNGCFAAPLTPSSHSPERPNSIFEPSFSSGGTRFSGPSLHRLGHFRGNRKQFNFFDAKCRRYADKRVQSRVQNPALELAYVGAMNASTFRERLLGHAELPAKDFQVG
jgi:hypothetical protein